MSEPDSLPAAVRSFVANQLGVPLSKVADESRLFHDLGCDGDDAIELLEAYCRTFRVDIREVDTNRYFGPEGTFIPFLWLLLKLFGSETLRRKPLTVADLIGGARTRLLRPSE